ncbi:MAG: DUF1761 domain-containing protein [Cyclobacteriaceae bacterium]
MNNLKINHLAVLVCLILLHALGFLWYGPLLFQEQWMGMVGLDPANMEGGADAGVWVTNFVASLAPLYVLAWLFTKLDVTSGIRGAGIAFLITFCFHHLSVMSGNMFAGAPYGLAWIIGGFSTVGITLSGFILGAWPKRNS